MRAQLQRSVVELGGIFTMYVPPPTFVCILEQQLLPQELGPHDETLHIVLAQQLIFSGSPVCCVLRPTVTAACLYFPLYIVPHPHPLALDGVALFHSWMCQTTTCNPSSNRWDAAVCVWTSGVRGVHCARMCALTQCSLAACFWDSHCMFWAARKRPQQQKQRRGSHKICASA